MPWAQCWKWRKTAGFELNLEAKFNLEKSSLIEENSRKIEEVKKDLEMKLEDERKKLKSTLIPEVKLEKEIEYQGKISNYRVIFQAGRSGKTFILGIKRSHAAWCWACQKVLHKLNSWKKVSVEEADFFGIPFSISAWNEKHVEMH